MKFVVDEQLPPSLARWLKARGNEAWHVVDLNMLRESDRRIAVAAAERAAVMVTKDKDYLEWRRVVPGLQVLWLRIGDVSNRILLAEVAAGWTQAEFLLAQGQALVALWPGGRVESIPSVP